MRKRLFHLGWAILVGLTVTVLLVSFFRLRDERGEAMLYESRSAKLREPVYRRVTSLVDLLDFLAATKGGERESSALPAYERALAHLAQTHRHIVFAALFAPDPRRLDNPPVLVRGIGAETAAVAGDFLVQGRLSPLVTHDLELGALLASLGKANGETLIVSPLHVQGSGQENAIERPVTLSGENAVLMWMLKPIREPSNGTLSGVIGLLVDWRAALSPLPARKGATDLSSGVPPPAFLPQTPRLVPQAVIHGPYPRDELHSIALRDESRRSHAIRPSAIESFFGSFRTTPRTHAFALPIGQQGFIVEARPVNAPLRTSILAYLASAILGIASALLVFGAISSERDQVAFLKAANARVLQRIEIKQRELNSSESRFKHLAESTNVIPWEANIRRSRFRYVGPQIEQLAGFPVETWYSEGFWIHHIHPDDRNRVLVEGFKNLRADEYTAQEYRIRNANNELMHVRNIMTVLPPARRDRQAEVAQGFIIDISDMKRAQQALEEARFHAEQANRSKSEFLANMSHELRTPLNAVIGFSEIMKSEIFGEIGERYRDYAESIHASGRHLLELINDVLDLSKIEAGKIELTEEETDIESLIDACRVLLSERAAGAGVTLTAVADGAVPAMILDERRMRQVLLNLVSNAIKFTPSGGSVAIEATYFPGYGVQITVTDTGVGMSAEDIPKAFEKFGQIDGELARKHEGTGLGLPIARSLIELHGGELLIDSAVGEGTRITINLPMERIRGYSENGAGGNAA